MGLGHDPANVILHPLSAPAAPMGLGHDPANVILHPLSAPAEA